MLNVLVIKYWLQGLQIFSNSELSNNAFIVFISITPKVCVFVWQVQALVRDSPLLTKLANSALYPLIYVVQQFIHLLFMGYSLVPFCLFTYDKWLKVSHNSQRPHWWKDKYGCSHLWALRITVPVWGNREEAQMQTTQLNFTRCSTQKQHWNQYHHVGIDLEYEIIVTCLTNPNKHRTWYPRKSTLGITNVSVVCERKSFMKLICV